MEGYATTASKLGQISGATNPRAMAYKKSTFYLALEVTAVMVRTASVITLVIITEMVYSVGDAKIVTSKDCLLQNA